MMEAKSGLELLRTFFDLMASFPITGFAITDRKHRESDLQFSQPVSGKRY
jgi:hypothetical protein